MPDDDVIEQFAMLDDTRRLREEARIDPSEGPSSEDDSGEDPDDIPAGLIELSVDLDTGDAQGTADAAAALAEMGDAS
jgi:hypothetical protein